ncbi:MAG: serine/threonine protein kinase [Clostridia bacterium]|nr:serine/threonine protein kinase [Clostridia bacterium]
MLEKDTTIVSESGQEYVVLSLVSEGTGQGDVYRVSSDGADYALKLFYGGNEEVLKEQVRVLMKRGHPDSVFVHPVDIVSFEGRVGYVMEYIPKEYLSGSVLYNGIERDGHREELPFHVKLSVLSNLAEAVSILYNANLAMMDLKFDNIKIHPETWEVKVLDMDTVVGSDNGQAFIEGTIGFMPPLTMRGEEQPSKYNDSFALAIIIFMTLFGSHPFMGQMAEDPYDGNLEMHLFAEDPVYVWHPNDARNRPSIDNMHTERRLLKYPHSFTEAFEATFVDGLFDKEKRTPPDRWCVLLRELYEQSYCCQVCGEEQFFAQTQVRVCDACDEMLVKPLLLCAEKSVPLFFRNMVRESDLWQLAPSDEPFAKVVHTCYKGKRGLMMLRESVLLVFPDGRSVDFKKGTVAPLFLNATYKYQNKEFSIQEG